MGDRTAISWSDATWNPVTGCTKVTPGCDHCYAETFAERWRGTPGHPFEQGFDLTLRPERLDQPLRWKRPRRIFVNSMSDLFHDQIPDDYIAQVFAVMELASQHTFQVLTKRHGRMRSLLSAQPFRTLVDDHRARSRPGCGDFVWPLPNVWLGVSVEDQQRADLRVRALLETPAAVRFLSCEPLLGPINLQRIIGRIDCLRGDVIDPESGDIYAACPSAIDWVIAGGESGHGARSMDIEWASALYNDCEFAGVPFFFKQTGTVLAREWGLASRPGADPAEWPEPFPQDFPAPLGAAA